MSSEQRASRWCARSSVDVPAHSNTHTHTSPLFHRSPQPARLVTSDYKRSAVASSALCRQACCDDPACVAATSVNHTASSVECYLHATDGWAVGRPRRTLGDGAAFLMRRRNVTLCGSSSAGGKSCGAGAAVGAAGASLECPKANGLTGKCGGTDGGRDTYREAERERERARARERERQCVCVRERGEREKESEESAREKLCSNY